VWRVCCALRKRIRLRSAQHSSYYAAIALTTSARSLSQLWITFGNFS